MALGTLEQSAGMNQRVSPLRRLVALAPVSRLSNARRALRTDVLVSGAGIPGLTAALLLARAGKRVTILPGKQDALHPSTHVGLLSQHLGASYSSLVREYGLETARAFAFSTRHAINTVRELGCAMGGCRFRLLPGYLFSENEEDMRGLREDCDAARAVGLKAVVSRKIPLPFPTAGGVRFPGQAQFDPSAYRNGLRRLARAAGVRILANARIESMVEGEPCVVRTTSGAEVWAGNIFLAAQQPFLQFPFLAGLTLRRRHSVSFPRYDNAPQALFWDSRLPSHQLHSARHPATGPLTISSDDDGRGLAPLLQYASSRLGRTVRDIISSSSVDVLRPMEALPQFGRRRPHSPVFIATGFGDNVFTLGTLAALVVTEGILGRPTRWTEGYAPAVRTGRMSQLSVERSA